MPNPVQSALRMAMERGVELVAAYGRELPVRFGMSAKRKRTFVDGEIQAALSAPAE